MSELALRELVSALHADHGVGGEPIRCIQCVVTALNEHEREYLRKVKDIQDNGNLHK